MKPLLKISCILLTAFITLSPTLVNAHQCGKVMGKQIEITMGNLSCSRAKAVYKSFMKGHTPKGWTCGQSVGGCGNGKQEFTFRQILNHGQPDEK